MTEDKRMVLLVGTNPLPNYLAAKALKAQSVLLIYSERTEDIKKALAKSLELLKPDFSIEEAKIENPYDASSVNEILVNKLRKGDLLNYTGGTKVMSTHALRVFLKEKEGAARDAFYLDDRDCKFLHADGSEKSYDELEVSFSIEEAFALHGASVSNSPVVTNESIETAKKEWCEIAAEDDEGHAARITRAIEIIVQAGIGKSLNDKESSKVRSGLICTRSNGQFFRLPIVLVHRHRLRVLNVTNKERKNPVKGVGFEAATRAVHVGGDLARPAVVCLSDNAVRDTVQTELRGIWPDDPTHPRIFGRDDLDELNDYVNGTSTKCSLTSWIEDQ